MSPELEIWLADQQLWLQIAANRLLCNGQLSEVDITELASIIKNPVNAVDVDIGTVENIRTTLPPTDLRLLSIGAIEGIDALCPRSPLSFGDKNLVVIYGQNGSGKSGYTRILCKACGKPSAANLKSNVFTPAPPRQSCKIKYAINGVETEVEWSATAPIDSLSVVDVFDTTSGRIYLDSETEAAFLPNDLSLMSDLVTTCRRVEAVLATEERALATSLPAITAELENTSAATAYRAINYTTAESELTTLSEWTQENSQELDTVNASLAVSDPLVAAERCRGVKRQREALANALTQAVAQLSGAELEVTRTKVIDAASKRRIADEAAEALKAKSAIDGVGTLTWRALWEAARDFATTNSLTINGFPNVEAGARCVLCHQELDMVSRGRLSAFESYVSGTIQTDASTAERERNKHLETIASRPSIDALQTAVQAAELDQQLATAMEEAWVELESHLAPLRGGTIPNVPYVPSEKVTRQIKSLRDLATTAETEAKNLSRSANPETRNAAEARKKELVAKKWVSEQIVAVRAEVERLKKVHSYQQWKRQTDTRGLSRKAGELSETLVTEAYIERFNSELTQLGANGIRVELVKTRTEQGRSKHAIRLRDVFTQSVRISDVLSEGERRIISLAAFLADVTGRNVQSPFIFDDPISSLDQTWEERTIDRLISLSASRQVIIFTHRLSLLGIITEKADELTSIHIRRESWGTGEPGDIPLAAKRPERVLNDLKGGRLVRAKRTLNESGSAEYYPLAKAICSDLRILTERLVEFVLLADVVQRHRRAVNTQGKIHSLAKIMPADCTLIDDMMTKYSRYEHSQSNEAPVEPPPPEEIEADIDRLLNWHQEFTTRTI